MRPPTCEWRLAGYQASLLAKMLMGSAVVSQRSHWELWFDAALVDGVHVLRTRSDLRDLRDKVAWLVNNDARARAMARAGREAVLALLDPKHLIGHVAALLARYEQLFALPGGRVDTPPPLRAIFTSLCAGGARSCTVYNSSSPPPRFATISTHRQKQQRSMRTQTERIRCPVAACVHRIPSRTPMDARFEGRAFEFLPWQALWRRERAAMLHMVQARVDARALHLLQVRCLRLLRRHRRCGRD